MPGDKPIPEWVTETPEDHAYYLDMYENGDVTNQSIDLTRAEFIELKRHLAKMRGHIPPGDIETSTAD